MLTTLGHKIYDLGTEVRDLIKVDVDGAEARVLRGVERVSAEVGPSWWIETHGWYAHDNCRHLLAGFGYEQIEVLETRTTGYGRLVAEGRAAQRRLGRTCAPGTDHD